MSHATRAWVDTAERSVFSSLCITFPLEKSPNQSLLALNRIAINCRRLTVIFTNTNATNPTPQNCALLPSLPHLTILRLICPPSSTFYPLLSFRLAIQSQPLRHLTQLSITNLTFKGILALRWGTLSSYGSSDATGAQPWHQLEILDISMLPCILPPTTNLCNPNKKDTAHDLTIAQEQEKEEGKQRDKETRRTGLKVLHDYLASFAATKTLRTLRFSWHENQQNNAPNPLLLDLKATYGSGETWFSAPKIVWQGLKAVYLRGVVVDEADMAEMYRRMRELERLVVHPGGVEMGGVGWEMGPSGNGIELEENVHEEVQLRAQAEERRERNRRRSSSRRTREHAGSDADVECDDVKGLLALEQAVDRTFDPIVRVYARDDGTGSFRGEDPVRTDSLVPVMLDMAAEENASLPFF